MSLRIQDEEKLENLPLRERNHDYSWENEYYRGSRIPYRRLTRWLEAQDGVHIDVVIHKFINLRWLPPAYRTLNTLLQRIEANTFFNEVGGVSFFASYMDGERSIKNANMKIIYVHPKSRCVMVHRPRTQKSYAKLQREERDKTVRILGDYYQITKIDGIWYFIRGEPQPEWTSNWRLERKAPREPLLEKNSEWQNKNTRNPFVKIIQKRQLNGKELKIFGLTNG
jgi:hypothetical protein